MNTFDKVVEILRENLDTEIEITPETNFVDDLEADSLEIVDLLLVFEEEFGCSIPDEKLSEIKTVGNIVTLIEENM